jgi:hypothetical protein
MIEKEAFLKAINSRVSDHLYSLIVRALPRDIDCQGATWEEANPPSL